MPGESRISFYTDAERVVNRKMAAVVGSRQVAGGVRMMAVDGKGERLTWWCGSLAELMRGWE